MTKELDVRAFTHPQLQRARLASDSLSAAEHCPDCPAFFGASMDCVWPLAVCVPDDFEPGPP